MQPNIWLSFALYRDIYPGFKLGYPEDICNVFRFPENINMLSWTIVKFCLYLVARSLNYISVFKNLYPSTIPEIIEGRRKNRPQTQKIHLLERKPHAYDKCYTLYFIERKKKRRVKSYGWDEFFLSLYPAILIFPLPLFAT